LNHRVPHITKYSWQLKRTVPIVHLQPSARLFSIFHSYENISIRLHSLVPRICCRMLDLVFTVNARLLFVSTKCWIVGKIKWQSKFNYRISFWVQIHIDLYVIWKLMVSPIALYLSSYKIKLFQSFRISNCIRIQFHLL